MASLQRFDGPNLEAVLADVHAAHGDSARILNAHRVRAGGIGGFFARERFEVEVEVADDDTSIAASGGAVSPVPAAEPGAVRTPTSILELADDVSARESAPAGAAAAAGAPAAPASFASLLAARLASEHARSTLDPTPGADEIADVFRADVAAPVASRLPYAPEAPAIPHPGVAAAIAAAAPAPAAAPAATPPPALVADSHSTGSISATRTLASAPPAVVSAPPVLPVAQPDPAGLVASTRTPGDVGTTVTRETPAARQVAAAPVTPALPAVATAPSSSAPASPANLRLPALAPLFEVDPFVARLTRRGLPVALVPAGRVDDVRAAVVALLEELPPVPTVPAGRPGVIVTVGEREEAYALARRIGSEHGAEEDHVVLASPTYRGRRIPAWGRLATVDEAVSERRSWRRRAGVTVVAVEAPVDGHATDWAAGMLAALEPNLIWGVVSAGRKTEDLAWWMDRLGGLDALAVEGSRQTMTPGSVLSLGVPVGLLDGERPTAGTWADLLLAGADR